MQRRRLRREGQGFYDFEPSILETYVNRDENGKVINNYIKQFKAGDVMFVGEEVTSRKRKRKRKHAALVMEFSMDSTLDCDICDKCKGKESYCCTNGKKAWEKYYTEKKDKEIIHNLLGKISFSASVDGYRDGLSKEEGYSKSDKVKVSDIEDSMVVADSLKVGIRSGDLIKNKKKKVHSICDKCKGKESFCCTDRNVAWGKYYIEKKEKEKELNLLEKISGIRLGDLMKNLKKKDHSKFYKQLERNHIEHIIIQSIKMDNTFNCSICYNEVNNNKMFIPLCGHAICTECALKIACTQESIKDTECPQCRKPLFDGLKKPIKYLKSI
jgi:hypothetical protein